VSIGQHSDQGLKPINQDFHGALLPNEPGLSAKGVCVAIADGISSSPVSQIASESAVKTFLEDYYCTSEAWSVRTAAERVLRATNSWLYEQTRQSEFRYDTEQGYVCAFSALVIKARTAHLVHAGDTRIYRLHGTTLEQLTVDHRQRVSDEESLLSRALGAGPKLEVDYRALPVEAGSTFILMTDGVYEHVAEREIVDAIRSDPVDLDRAARAITEAALAAGSEDNLTVQIVRVDSIPAPQAATEILGALFDLPLAPLLERGMMLDGYEVVRQLHVSHRSHVYLAMDPKTTIQVVLKVPSVELREDPAALERFLMEEWIAKRVRSAHVLEPSRDNRKRSAAYVATAYVDGTSLAQWMRDHPRPDVETVRGIVEQIARGLRAFHRQDMLHQDLRPENVLIDRAGTVKIIDFGSVRVAGVEELETSIVQPHLLGTAQYTAPEYLLGEPGSEASDIFSLGVITYQLLSGRLPYGASAAQARTRAAQRRLVYQSVLAEDREIPAWIDDALKRATHPNPLKRYTELSEFVYDLRHPNKAFLTRGRRPLLERNPVAFWRAVSLILAIVVVVLLSRRLPVEKPAASAATRKARQASELAKPPAEFVAFACPAQEVNGSPVLPTALASPYDHVQVVIATPAGQAWAQRGQPCSAASAPAECLASYRQRRLELSPPRRPCTDDHGCPSSACAVTTLGDKVQTWCSEAELRSLVGTVDSAAEAFLLAHAQSGAALPICGVAEMSAFRKQAEGYELRERRYTKACRPVERTEFIYLVRSDGGSRLLSRDVLSSDREACQSEDPDTVRKLKPHASRSRSP
jgi:serine/threonine protein phosphatase PrpC